MKKLLPIFFACIGLNCFVACSNGSTTDSTAAAKEANTQKFDSTNIENDTKFAVNAADAGKFEVEAGNLALANASAANVKAFAQTMVEQHTAANNELSNLALQKKITLPAALSDEKQKKYSDLSAKKGADFDKAYVDCMVDGHKAVLDAFQKESDKGNDNDLRNWATAKLPTIQHHLEMIKSIKDAKK